STGIYILPLKSP
ncbi:metalloprotease, insulinase family domain protein, partial [Chlamydia psittaci 84-8471/1]